MLLNDNHLLRSPVEPGWSEMIHDRATPGPPGWVVEQSVFPVVRRRWQLPFSYLFLNHGN